MLTKHSPPPPNGFASMYLSYYFSFKTIRVYLNDVEMTDESGDPIFVDITYTRRTGLVPCVTKPFCVLHFF